MAPSVSATWDSTLLDLHLMALSSSARRATEVVASVLGLNKMSVKPVQTSLIHSQIQELASSRESAQEDCI